MNHLLAILLCLLQPDPAKTRVYKQAAEMDYGPVFSATVGVTKDNIVPKGLVLRVSKAPEAYVLFDTELLRVAAAWTGGWIQLAGRAYADDSNDYPWVKGEVVAATERAPGWAGPDGSFADPRPEPRDGPLPRDWARFLGHYIHGDRAVVSYTVGNARVLESFGFADGKFTRTRAIAGSGTPKPRTGDPIETKVVSAGEFDVLIQGGPARWPDAIVLAGKPGPDDAAYAVDSIPAPEQNPWKSWMRFTGIDFFPDGRAALCTWSGDVWIVSGLDATLEKVTWKRFAAGINNPMGLKIVDGKVLVSGRDQITRLHDLNGDGEADFHECFFNGIKLTTNFHEFVFDLQTDAAGNFYTAKGSSIWAGSLRMTDHHGTLWKIAKDGSSGEILATGLRAPNGVGVSPDGLITCADNQGNWVPECPINWIRPGGHYGFTGHNQKPQERDKPVCWIPMSVDKSTGSQTWVPDDRWGPLKGRMIASSYDCSMSLVLFEKIEGGYQGGVVRFPFPFASGVMRNRFNPADGALYLAGLRGWSSRASRDCCFNRVRWTGKPVHLPVQVTTRKGGLDVAFSAPLDAASVADPDAIGATGFNVVRTGNYGSSEFSLVDPKKQGRSPVEIQSSKLGTDGKTIALEMPGLKPMTNLVLKIRVKSAEGAPVAVELDYTLHAVPE